MSAVLKNLTDYREDPIAGHVEAIISHLGEDAGRPGMRDTPKRFAKAMRALTSGYEGDPASVVTTPPGEIFRMVELLVSAT